MQHVFRIAQHVFKCLINELHGFKSDTLLGTNFYNVFEVCPQPPRDESRELDSGGRATGCHDFVSPEGLKMSSTRQALRSMVFTRVSEGRLWTTVYSSDLGGDRASVKTGRFFSRNYRATENTRFPFCQLSKSFQRL